MARARRTPSPSSPPSPSITHGVLRLASVTGHTALRDAQEVGAQLVLMAQQVVRGTRSASAAIAGDIADVARRSVGGMADGVRELRADLGRLRPVSRKPAAKAAARRRPARRRKAAAS
jgi:hypothetical protein